MIFFIVIWISSTRSHRNIVQQCIAMYHLHPSSNTSHIPLHSQDPSEGLYLPNYLQLLHFMTKPWPFFGLGDMEDGKKMRKGNTIFHVSVRIGGSSRSKATWILGNMGNNLWRASLPKLAGGKCLLSARQVLCLWSIVCRRSWLMVRVRVWGLA